MEAHVGGRSASYMTPDLIYEREGAGEIDGVGKTLAPGITPVSNLKGAAQNRLRWKVWRPIVYSSSINLLPLGCVERCGYREAGTSGHIHAGYYSNYRNPAASSAPRLLCTWHSLLQPYLVWYVNHCSSCHTYMQASEVSGRIL